MKVGKNLLGNIFWVCCFLCVSGYGYAEECKPECQKKLVENYFHLLNEVYKNSSTEEDIAALFTLFHEDVKYEHLDYGASFGKSEWQEAFKANLERGAYKGAKNDHIKVTNFIAGKSHAAVEYKYGSLTKDGSWQPKDGPGLLALFGFQDNKIVLVREYW